MAPDISPEVDALWQRFHTVVNMTSRELADWLGVEPDLSPQPGQAGPSPLGLAVLDVLGKRRSDVTPRDLETMQKVLDVVEEERAQTSPKQLAEDERSRHRLMNVGHDPLRTEPEA
jgi:hypothetical protein